MTFFFNFCVIPAFVALCEAVSKLHVIGHFLLGNNLALAGDVTGEREAALVKTMVNENVKVETWYLAGNGIGHEQIQRTSAALERSEHAKYTNKIKIR